MAGIGQYTMGRTMIHDCSKPVTSYGGNLTKRPLFGSGSPGITGAPTFSDIANLSSTGYVPRSGSSQRNGEVFNSIPGGLPLRNTYPVNPDSALENGPVYFGALNYNGGQQRNFSEQSLMTSLSTINRTASNDLASNRVGIGSLAPSMPINNVLAIPNVRNSGNVYPNSIGNENGLPSISNTNLSSSTRGVTLDPSDFPPILNSVGRSGNNSTPFHSSASQPSLRKYLSIMSKGSSIDTSLSQVNQQFSHSGTSQPTPLEFSKQDFPALPGSQQLISTVSASTTTVLSSNSISPTNRFLSTNQVAKTTTSFSVSASSNRAFASTSQLLGSSTNSNQLGLPSVPPKLVGSLNGIQLLPNHLVTNIPKNMIYDQFGMLGLLKLIRVGDYDATLNMLAPGLDLSSLHNNWQTHGELHSTFVSPCHDSCIGRPPDLDFTVPSEYLIRHLVTDNLPDPPMNQLSEETLFWLFYNCCREEAQLVVAKELYQREWRFHKKEQIWLTRILGAQFTTDNNSEQGEYYFWDPLKAQKSTHQMTILYSDLDNAPTAFRLSSNTLSAFISIDLPGNGSCNSVGSHANMTQQQSQQQLVAAYQQSKPPPPTQQQQQPYSHPHSTLATNNLSGPVLPLTANSLTTGSAMGSSTTAANLANFFNARQQPGPPPQSAATAAFNKPSQLSPNQNLYSSLGRTGQLNSLFAPRLSVPNTLSSNVNNSTNNLAAVITTSVEANVAPISAFSRTSTSSVLHENSVHSQSGFDDS